MKNKKKSHDEENKENSHTFVQYKTVQDKPTFYVQLAIAIATLLTLLVIAYQMIVQSRAWVTVKKTQHTEFQAGKPVTITLLIANSGKSPALNLTIHNNICLRENPVPTPIPLAESDQDLSKAIIAPDSEYFSIGTIGIITEPQIKEIREGKRKLYVWGRIEYDDIFRFHRTTDYCFVSRPETVSFDVCSDNNTAN